MIELKAVNKVYPSKAGDVMALQEINLSVASGEIYGVIGRSGAGKSTLIRCVNLLERPTSGQVIVDQKDLMTLSERQLREVRHSIAMVFQHFNLLSSRNVFDNVALPLELIGKDKIEIKKTVMELLDLVGLENRKQAFPSQLSGGQKQRVAIARALALNPKVLLCDEMTSALDPETTESILKLVKRINDELKLTMLLITHEMEVIKTIADHVAVLDGGKIIEKTDVVSLFKNPQTEIAKSFAQSTFKLELPHKIANKIQQQPIENSYAIVRISMVGHSTEEPMIDDLVRHYKVRVNILQGNIEFLRQDMVGMMVVALQGSLKEISEAKAYMLERGLSIEELGYVSADDWFDS